MAGASSLAGRDMVEKPYPVMGLKGVNVVQADIGGWHTLCVTDKGQVTERIMVMMLLMMAMVMSITS